MDDQLLTGDTSNPTPGVDLRFDLTTLPNHAPNDEVFRTLVEQGLQSLAEGRASDLNTALHDLAREFGPTD